MKITIFRCDYPLIKGIYTAERLLWDELKGLTNEEYIKRVREQADTILARYNIKLERIEARKDPQKVA